MDDEMKVVKVERQARFDVMMVRTEPHMKDLLWKGSMVRKFPRKPNSPRVLQFRQHYSGTRDGRQL
jgi:hypothetical protein